MEQELTNAIFNLWLTVSSVITGATLIVHGLEKIAKVTPSTKDDEAIKGIKQKLGVVAAILDKLALNKRDK